VARRAVVTSRDAAMIDVAISRVEALSFTILRGEAGSE